MGHKINDTIFETFPNLESERLLFRSFSEKDAYDLFKIRSDDSLLEYMDTNKMSSVDEANRLIEAINTAYNEKRGINWKIIEKDKLKMIGYFGVWRIIREHCWGEIGYVIKTPFQRMGYMQETFSVLLPFAFNCIGLHRLEANINPNNKKSISLVEKNGFRKEAYFRENYLFNGKFLDSLIYSLLETEYVRP